MTSDRIDNQVILSDKALTAGSEFTPNTRKAAGEKRGPGKAEA